jgi:hypothetical protein
MEVVLLFFCIGILGITFYNTILLIRIAESLQKRRRYSNNKIVADVADEEARALRNHN